MNQDVKPWKTEQIQVRDRTDTKHNWRLLGTRRKKQRKGLRRKGMYQGVRFTLLNIE